MKPTNPPSDRKTPADSATRALSTSPRESGDTQAAPADLKATASGGQSVAGGTGWGGFRINHNQSLLQD